MHTVTEADARAWLLRTLTTVDNDTVARALINQACDIKQLPRKPDDEMWGPDDFADWSHDDLVWRIVFLQCVLRDVTGPVR
jgi:hypothetical protein